MSDQTYWRVGVAKVSIHHIGYGGAVLTLAVHYHTKEPAAPFLLVVTEHLQGKKVVGG